MGPERPPHLRPGVARVVQIITLVEAEVEVEGVSIFPPIYGFDEGRKEIEPERRLLDAVHVGAPRSHGHDDRYLQGATI